MSKADLNQFFQEALSDQELQAKFQEANRANDRQGAANLAAQLGQERGYSFSVDEARAYLEELIAASDEQELSDAQLEAVAGGRAAAFTDNWGCAAD